MDGNVIINIAEGNGSAAEALLRRQRSGARVYIARAAYNEVITGAATPEIARQYDALLRDAKIHVAPESTDPKVRAQQLADRVKFYEAQLGARRRNSRGTRRSRPRNGTTKMVGAVDEYGAGVHASRPGRRVRGGGNREPEGPPVDLRLKRRGSQRKPGESKSLRSSNVSAASTRGRPRKCGHQPGKKIAGNSGRAGAGRDATTEARVNAAARPTAAKRTGLRLTAGLTGRAIVSVGAVALNYAAAIGLHFLERWMMRRALDNKLKEGLEGGICRNQQDDHCVDTGDHQAAIEVVRLGDDVCSGPSRRSTM